MMIITLSSPIQVAADLVPRILSTKGQGGSVEYLGTRKVTLLPLQACSKRLSKGIHPLTCGKTQSDGGRHIWEKRRKRLQPPFPLLTPLLPPTLPPLLTPILPPLLPPLAPALPTPTTPNPRRTPPYHHPPP